MAYHKTSQDAVAPPLSIALPLPQLHLQFRDFALDPLPKLVIRVRCGRQEKTYTTDETGGVDGIYAPAGANVRIEVQRFDGSFKQIEDTDMPSVDTTWNYISPQIVLDVETQLHQGDIGTIEAKIPKAVEADDAKHNGSAGTAKHDQAPGLQKSQEPEIKKAKAPNPQAVAAVQVANPPCISGGQVRAARQTPQAQGRTTQGHPMTVLTQKLKDWWNSWTLPSLSLLGKDGEIVARPASAILAKGPQICKDSKVLYDQSMLSKVSALIDFAEEQTEYAYGKSEGTAAVLAQMATKKFSHSKNEKDSDKSTGRCYQYVRIALTRAGVVGGYVADNASAKVQESASLAGQPLLEKGFVDVTDEVPDARWAAAGDVIVYAWSDATWNARKKQKGPQTANHGHIDIRSNVSYISDFMPKTMHPAWWVASRSTRGEFEPNYVGIRIYRKYYDPRPTCRIRAFLACLREFETQSIKSEADRYRALNTPLPTAPGEKFFTSFRSHPWGEIPRSEWKKGVSTASGAYQITFDTAEGFRLKRYLCDVESGDIFSPASQDRLAVMLIEEKNALGAVREGKIDAAVAALGGVWASLPGASQNHGRKTADGRPMDMSYLMGIYSKSLLAELEKFGITK